MKNKRGSHVGLILSFVVFVTFLFFILSVLNPAVKEQENKKTNLDLLKTNLLGKIVSNLSVTSLRVSNETNYTCESDVETPCFEINNFLEDGNGNITIKNESGGEITGGLIGGKIWVVHEEKKFFKLYHSVELTGQETSVDGCIILEQSDSSKGIKGNYTLTTTRTQESIFENKIIELLNYYDLNYSQLKEELEFSSDSEFGLSFTNSSGDEIQKGFRQVSGNVYIEEIPVQYYNSEAEMQSGSIKIRVW